MDFAPRNVLKEPRTVPQAAIGGDSALSLGEVLIPLGQESLFPVKGEARHKAYHTLNRDRSCRRRFGKFEYKLSSPRTEEKEVPLSTTTSFSWGGDKIRDRTKERKPLDCKDRSEGA
ncbi:hypothetical protein Leryth_022780 [Lithospermum erythrorhizon]|nr:hypothetical protein Leryth_022780 [Lithospermum erythrorhizon]